jgi:chromosome segregation ATPase
LEALKKKNDEITKLIDSLEKELTKKNEEHEQVSLEERKMTDDLKKQEKNIKDKNRRKDELIEEVKSLSREVNNCKDLLNKTKIKYDDSIRELKDSESNLIKNKTSLEEENNVLNRELNHKKNLKADITRLTENIKKLKNDLLLKDQKEKDQLEFKKQELGVKDEFEKEAKNLEEVKENLLDKVDELEENIEEMKNLRETISRTVQRLEESTKSINEEINIKELIYLDMTKKNEELRHMYQKYHMLYETVLAERNKNVVKIQNANQRRAELKEKMKIITTEMDILNSELSEIYTKLLEKDKDLNKINARQNVLKQEINSMKLKKLTFKEEITKLTNENEKLHSMLNSIESDMVTIRIDYELACENRNYTGIQLIDRNDELCIFYEKIQQLETEIKELYKNILDKEAKLQKYSVENSEIERYIEVNRMKIPEIPLLSNKIKELDNELKILNKTLEDLIKYIESPHNNLKNELPGEDPDIDYLRMKYDQLADMLNEKKEALLEKELINEEINDIAEKLRKKALEDREKNLDLSEKMNEYEMKLNDITRKNIASTSELSMFKAILFKLEETKSKKEKLLEDSMIRIQNNMPPTDDCMKNWETMNNISRQKKDYLEKRHREVREKEEMPVGEFPHRRRPEKRNDLFPDPVTGLPVPYGKHSEFYPNRPNLRHYKNMKPLKFEGSSGQVGTFGNVGSKEKVLELN